MRRYRVRAIIDRVMRETEIRAHSHADAQALARGMFPRATQIWVDQAN